MTNPLATYQAMVSPLVAMPSLVDAQVSGFARGLFGRMADFKRARTEALSFAVSQMHDAEAALGGYVVLESQRMVDGRLLLVWRLR